MAAKLTNVFYFDRLQASFSLKKTLTLRRITSLNAVFYHCGSGT